MKKILLLIITLTVCVSVQADYYPEQYTWSTEVFYGTANIARKGGPIQPADSDSQDVSSGNIWAVKKDTVRVSGMMQTFMLSENMSIDLAYRNPDKLEREYDMEVSCPSCKWDWKYTDRDLQMLEAGVKWTESFFRDDLTFAVRLGLTGVEYTTTRNYLTNVNSTKGYTQVSDNQKDIVPYIGATIKYHVDNWFISANIHRFDADFRGGEDLSYQDASLGIGYSY